MRLYCFRSRLDYEKLVKLAILGPLDVHGPLVVVFNNDRPACKSHYLFVAETERALFLLRGSDIFGGGSAAAVNNLAFFSPYGPADNRQQFIII